MWEDNRHLIRDFDDVIFLNTQETIVKSVEQQLAWNEADIQRHAKMEKSPYFGRVDFLEGEAGEADTIYIGVYSLTDEESQEIYVVDWRAPISSMFYQFDAGPAWYEVHGHKNQVEITGKRQYRIEDGRLLSVYDTDSSMYDDILVQALSEYSDHKLKVIAGSIQREQNAAIRSDTKSSCLIYGLAGSGKTSIGLHRLAYVLYRDRETIKSENILILSNNNIFGSYISTILPDLGEKPAQTKVFGDFLEAFLGEGLEIDFGYSLNGIPVLTEGGRAARFLVAEGGIVQFSLYLRSYTTAGTGAPILPARQAAAAVRARGLKGRELLLTYSDTGGDSLSAGWSVRDNGEG